MKTTVLFLMSLALVSTSLASTNYVDRVDGETTVKVVIDGQFSRRARNDVLFVVDDSGSMSAHQNNLRNHINVITRKAKKTKSRFHIGVVGTSTFETGTFSVPYKETGELIGQPRYFTPGTKDLEQVLSERLLVGSNGAATEAPFEAIFKALQSPLLDTVNKGFSRRNSRLSIVFLTDTDDQSALSAADLRDFLVQHKADANLISVHGVIVTSDDLKNQTCKGEQLSPTKIEEFIGYFGGSVYSLCAKNYVENLSTIGDAIFPEGGTGEYGPAILIDEIKLVAEPNDMTIKVTHGTQVLLRNQDWFYNPFEQKIVFAQDIDWRVQPPGTFITITYKPAE